MEWTERITADRAILCGRPAIRGTRLSVELVLGRFASGSSREQVLECYPHLDDDAFDDVFTCARDLVHRASRPFEPPLDLVDQPTDSGLMKYERFERHAREIFEAIPAELRQGVEFVSVSPDAVRHPEMPDVFTLAECATGELDLPGGLAADARSGVYLYHGSFREMARRDPGFDWDDELRETILHEIRHHRESLAGEDALEDLDWAEEENRKRRDGKAFDPLFYRRGTPVAAGTWEVDGDLFVERELSAEEFERDDEIEVTIDGTEIDLGLPERLGDVHFIYLDGLWDEEIDVAVVLVRRQGAWEQLRRVVSSRRPEVLSSSMDYSDVELQDDDTAT